MTTDLLSAVVIGLLGAGHCIGMCGGISTMFTSALDTQKPILRYVIGYNFGRIFSYTIAGGIAGFTASLASKSIGVPVAWLQLIAAIFLIFLGLYIGQWLFILNRIEKLGQGLWQYISPLSKKILPVNTVNKSVLIGMLWGWLPCGLVYSTLTWSLASGNMLKGAAIMFCFGLGTLPALFTTSLGMKIVKDLLTNLIFRKIIAISLIIYGAYCVQVAYFSMN